jgi:hypothetical protein
MMSIGCTAYETPTMGWSTWNTFDLDISESIILSQAYALAHSPLKDLGYTYVNIDAGCFCGRDEQGNLLLRKEAFPHPLRHLVDSVHALGLKAGTYSDAGANSCSSIWRKDKNGMGIGLFGHEQKDMDYFFKTSDLDFIKIDYCGAQQQGLNEEETFRRIKKAVDNTGKKGVRINVCRWEYPGTWVNEVATSWRVTSDIRPEWRYIRRIIAENYYLSAYAGGGHYNDMDMLEVGNGMNNTEEQTHFGMWCMLSSPLLLGCDLTKISDSSLALLTNKELIDINQDRLGLQAAIVRKAGDAFIFAKDLEHRQGNLRVFAVYNPSDAPVAVTVDFAGDCLLSGDIKLRDLFQQQDVTPTTERILKVDVAPHETKIYRITGKARLEQTHYEAETAWLKRYQELAPKDTTTAKYGTRAEASGGAEVIQLGGNPDNYMEWRDAYSQKGGSYSIEWKYNAPTKRNLTLTVNGKSMEVKGLIGTGTFRKKMKLKRGYNTIRIGNDKSMAPNIDVMILHKIQ